ncbi:MULTISPECIES: cellulose synthase complex periplasmic endoglucanase BcsZ [Paraburkholderia]|jgi:endoglucanase|uniref:cellulase n=2 Tax=Paraburkholderia hospita TaxID=169430 RepID=A0AAN1JDH3_9BURK|nr:cellulase [Paraburkholderia hospita]EIN01846.1 endo-1,4-D-glucanase [Paraburkholderia hospita]OUL88260.1 endoglucanase [Paraburkholderia hospita]SEH91932.1 endoglucanase [Paraburkholderia hospita]
MQASFLSRPWHAALACAVVMVGMTGHVQAATCDDWSAYRAFVSRFVQQDGRVVDFSTPTQQTTSEGQSYGMFFALVANDRATFERVLRWTRANLSAGRFDGDDVKLPSWQWGKKPDGAYGVLDPNSAADSDLWIAYDLFEAGRLWHEPAYTKLAYALVTQIEKQEVADLRGLGPMLLPGPQGFRNGGTTRLNPSYLPLPLLRALAAQSPNGPWARVADNAFKLVKTTAPLGFAPDWAAYRDGQRDGQFIVDPQKGDVGSYDAIRVYLWAGLTAPADPLAKPWLAALHGMRDRIAQTGVPPEKVATTTGNASGEGPIGFWGALLPYFRALGDTRAAGLAQTHLASLATPTPAPAPGAGQATQNQPVYYDEVLMLFGTGSADGRYRFDENGRLVPRWENSCQSANARS